MNKLQQDLRYGIRMLIRNPGFTLTAVLSLALGIGANTAVFSLVNALLLRQLPVEKPDELMRIYTGSSHTSYPNYRDLVEQGRVFSSLAAHSIVPFNLGQGENSGRVFGEMVTGNYFSTLGVHATLGQTFSTEVDSEPGAYPVAVISHGLWKKRFGSDPQAVGQVITLNGRQFTVRGIAPEGFHGTYAFGLAPELWVPITMLPQLQSGTDRFNDRGNEWLEVFGRLQPGVSVAQAQAQVAVITKRLAEAYPDQNRRLERTELYQLSGIAAFRGFSFAPVIFVFLGVLTVIVALVLLIACANVANLLLARAWARQKEIAIRLAVGAGRRRLIRQLLTESVTLSLGGGVIGCLLAGWLTAALRSLPMNGPVPLEFDFTLDLRVLAFTFVISLLAGVLFGLAPAWHSSRADIVALLKDDTGRGRITARFGIRDVLVIGQVAVSLLLLICSGLFIRSLQQARTVNPGFETERVLTATLDLRSAGYKEDRGRLFYQQLLERVEQLPGIHSASLAEIIPLTFSRTSFGVAIEGSESADRSYPPIDNNTVGPRYFETMGIPFLLGRDFGKQDREGSPGVVIINETMARRFFAGQNPLGRRLRFPQDNGTFSPFHEIVGVVKDSKYATLGEDPRPVFYLPTFQRYSPETVLHVRTMGDAGQSRTAVRDAVLAMDRSLLVEVATMQENISLAFLPARIAAGLLGMFGLLGVILASTGIYGIISYAASQRTNEIGIRMALGARPLDVFRLVMGQGMKLTLIGVIVGVGASFALTRLLSSLLVGVSTADPVTFVGITLVISTVGLLACYLPARRAMKVDPLKALRYE